MRQIETHNEREALKADLVFDEGVGIYTRASESENPIPYCPVCWGQSEKLVPLVRIVNEGFRCVIHQVVFRKLSDAPPKISRGPSSSSGWH